MEAINRFYDYLYALSSSGERLVPAKDAEKKAHDAYVKGFFRGLEINVVGNDAQTKNVVSIPCDPFKAYCHTDPKTGAVSVCSNFVFPCGGSFAGWVPYALAVDWMSKVARLGKRPNYFRPAVVFKCGYRHKHLKDCPWMKALREFNPAPAYVALEKQGFWERLVNEARVKDRLRPCACVRDLDGEGGPSADDDAVQPHDDPSASLEPKQEKGAEEGADGGDCGCAGSERGVVHAAGV